MTPSLWISAASLLLITTATASQPPLSSTAVVKSKAGPINVERLVSLEQPWGLAYLPDGRLLITEKPGRLRTYSDGKLTEPIRGMPKVEHKDQGGLLDVEIDPDFANNNLIYFYFVERADTQPDVESDQRDPRVGPEQDLKDVVLKGGAVARGRLDGSELRDVAVIWRQEPKTIGRGHFGGRLTFAAGGKLFITSGDRQRFDPAQDLSTNLGKVVRINSDGTIPDDNPFVKSQGAHPDIWSLGHRNALGAAIHPSTGKLWINEMGPWHGDELNVPEAGKNYGWPIVSNGDNYDGTDIPDHATRPDLAPPFEYWHPAISPSGMIFYTGTLFPEWKGSLLLGGLSSEVLLRLTLEGDRVKTEERIDLGGRIRDVVQSPDGAVLVVTDPKEGNGELLRLTPAGK